VGVIPAGTSNPVRAANSSPTPSACTPPDEGEHSQGLLVEPLRVVDADQQGALFRGLREQRECRESDQETVGGRAVGQSARHPQRLELGLGQCPDLLQVVQERHEYAVQRREGEPRLRLHSCHAQDPQVGGLRGRVVQQDGLADAAAQQDDTAQPLP
jgi:hypothetical protein